MTPTGVGGGDAEPSAEQAAAALESAHARWVGACAQVTTDNELFDRLIDASVRDLHALMMPVGTDQLPAAGIPWYVAPFGRDSLLSACESLMINPEVARGTLLVLAGLQAHHDEAWRDAEPGKILHELRIGELARTGHIPHTPYYGTVDATPLFLMVAGGYYRWTLDLDTMRQLRPALDAALAWIDEWGDRDGDGFVEYERRAPAGLINHGWKDSHDSIVHADGSIAKGPIALVEVQGYVYEAKLRIADVYEALGDSPRADRLRAEAGELRAAFNEAFWDPDEGFFVLALDGRKVQVRSVTSNPAHCLYCGIVDDDKAALVAERLMAADMFSGWGIRTLSGGSPAYNPMSYHNGSVWPHDNAIAAAGLKRYGFDAATNRIAAGLFDVAAGRARLPPARAVLWLSTRRIESDRRLSRRVHPAGLGGHRAVHAGPGDAWHLRARTAEPADSRPAAAPGLARSRRDSRHSRRQLEGQPGVSPDRAQHRVLAARAAGQRARHDVDMTSVDGAPSTDPAMPPPLARRFEAIVFDWDGTAVPDRHADATRMRRLVEEACAAGLELAVVSGTHVGNVDGQLAARPAGPGAAGAGAQPRVRGVPRRSRRAAARLPADGER